MPERICPKCQVKHNNDTYHCPSCHRKIRIAKRGIQHCSLCHRQNLIVNLSLMLCMTCNRNRLNPDYKTSKNEWERRSYRKKRNLPEDAPHFYAPKGSGHVEKKTGYKKVSGWINELGYRVVSNKDHPNASKTGKNRYKVFEHTVVMSEFLGRPLRKGESVHHKNGIRDDNRIENLELWSKKQPAGQRVCDKIEWAKSFLEEYGYSVIEKDKSST